MKNTNYESRNYRNALSGYLNEQGYMTDYGYIQLSNRNGDAVLAMRKAYNNLVHKQVAKTLDILGIFDRERRAQLTEDLFEECMLAMYCAYADHFDVKRYL